MGETMNTNHEKYRIDKYGQKACCRCGEEIPAGSTVEPVPVPYENFVRWAHVGCQFPEGFTMGRDGEMAKISDVLHDPEYIEGGSLIEDGAETANNCGSGSAIYGESPEPSPDESLGGEDSTQAEAPQDGAEDELGGSEVESDSSIEGNGQGEASDGLPSELDSLTDLLKSEVARATAGIASKVMDYVDDDITKQVTKAANDLADSLADTMKELVSKIPPDRIVVEMPDAEDVELDGEMLHEKAQEVLDLVTANPRENVLLVGPAGSGKTFLHKQIAKILGMRAGMISCSAMMSEAEFLGRSIPNLQTGEMVYQGTEFLDFFENGGVWLFDEADAADSNALLVINSATSNGEMAVPLRRDNPVAKKHDDFICLCAANTFGNGADRMYVGRNQQDAAWLDRFNMGTVEMDYDERIERMLCPDANLLDTIHGWRNEIRMHKLRRVCSTRFIKSAYKMHTQKGWGLDKISEKFFAGWSDDEKRKVM